LEKKKNQNQKYTEYKVNMAESKVTNIGLFSSASFYEEYFNKFNASTGNKFNITYFTETLSESNLELV